MYNPTKIVDEAVINIIWEDPNVKLSEDVSRRLEAIYCEAQRALDLSDALAAFLEEGRLELSGEDLIQEADRRGWGIGESYACGMLMELGLSEREARELLKDGCLRLEVLDPDEFTSDPVYRVLRNVRDRRGSFILEPVSYAPYESFMTWAVCSLGSLKDYRIAYTLGFFQDRFDYVQLRSGNRIWMSLSPYELRTMRAPVKSAHGKVLALGLGLGYYPLSCCLSDRVSKVTVLENSKDAVALFTETILPRFDTRNKLEIVRGDGFSFLEAHGEEYDTIFIDTYHDEVDGFEALRRSARYRGRTERKVDLWIEESLLSRFRIQVICALDSLSSGRTYDDSTVSRLLEVLKDVVLEGPENLNRLLESESLYRLVSKI